MATEIYVSLSTNIHIIAWSAPFGHSCDEVTSAHDIKLKYSRWLKVENNYISIPYVLQTFQELWLQPIFVDSNEKKSCCNFSH